MHLLDSNVLIALADDSHIHHASAERWLAAQAVPFATCPITQGALVRVLLHTRAVSTTAEAAGILELIVADARHRFLPDDIGYTRMDWRGVIGHRQVTDAYLAALARHHGAKLATLDRGLAALHADIAVLIA